MPHAAKPLLLSQSGLARQASGQTACMQGLCRLPCPGFRIGLFPDLGDPRPRHSAADMEKAARIKAELKALEIQLEALLDQAFGLRPLTPGDGNLHQKVERLVAAIAERCSELDALKRPVGDA